VTQQHGGPGRTGPIRNELKTFLQPTWVAFAIVIIAFPTVAGLIQQPSVQIQAPMELFELGFEILALIFPLLAVGLYVIAFSSETANRWIVYVRARTSLRRYLALKLCTNALVSFSVFFVAVAVWGLVAFGIAPRVGWAPNGLGPELSGHQILDLTVHEATFSQVAAAGTWLYVLVYAAWVGLWAAAFSSVALLLLLLTNNRLLAFAAPLVLYWVDNVVLANLGLESLRAVTSAFPFAIRQQPIASAIVPLLVWAIFSATLARVLAVRRLEVPALL
jgi:hypothetical protein